MVSGPCLFNKTKSMRRYSRILFTALLAAAAAFNADAKVRLPKVISDCMVLQRDVELNVWGWADPGEKVTVRFDGNHYFTQADSKGNWAVKLAPHKAGGPYLLEVNEIILRDVLVGDVWLLSGQSNQETPIERLVDRYPEINVSNNHMIRLYKVPTQETPGVLNEDILQGERWHSGVASDIMNWKALAYFFAVEAYEKTGVPQGMLVSSLGGSRIESWIAEEYLLQIPEQAAQKAAADQAAAQQREQNDQSWLNESYDDSQWATVIEPNYLADSGIPNGVVFFRKEIDVPASMDGRHAKIYMGRMVDGDQVYVNGVLVGQTTYFGPPRKYDIPAGLLHEGRNVVAVRLTANAGDAGFVPDKPYKIVGDEAEIDLTGEWKYKQGPAPAGRGMGPGGNMMARGPRFTGAGLYNGMIWPVRNYNIAGAVWYQGESNAAQADKYQALLTRLISNWREVFSMPEMPFLICQLPNYMEKYDTPTDSDWARLREAQMKTHLSVPNTSLAVCYNTGEYNDIHPLNKKDLAKTLYIQAEDLYLHRKVVSSGPVYKDMKIVGNKIIISFTGVGGGLRAQGGKLQHFAIAGADRNFVWADAEIKGNTVVVSSPAVPDPVAVRYAWANNPDNANLTNKEGFLASPFRTDDWEYQPETRRKVSY